MLLHLHSSAIIYVTGLNLRILRKLMIRIEFLYMMIRLFDTHLVNLLAIVVLQVLFLQMLMSRHYMLHQTGLVPSLVWTEITFKLRIDPTFEVVMTP